MVPCRRKLFEGKGGKVDSLEGFIGTLEFAEETNDQET